MRLFRWFAVSAGAMIMVASQPLHASTPYSASSAVNSAVQSAVQSARDDAWRRARAQQNWELQMQRWRKTPKKRPRPPRIR
jgi:archaellum component FlaF (FlaF/FlaG flagellin family)